MKRFILLFLLTFHFAVAALPAFAGVDQLTEAEFRELAAELAPKVNLFRDVWEREPRAEFYGGTSRDFLYWIKGRFREAKSREQAEKIRGDLRKLPAIDIRDFVIGESDVDIASPGIVHIESDTYGVRRIDTHGMNVFDPNTPEGLSEIDQGYIPAEKIRLGSKGIVPSHFGDGAKEVYSGRLTLHAPDPEKFAKTLYAKEKLNHPVLLALRFLRLQAINYFNDYDKGFPNKRILFDIDPASAQFVREQVQAATRHAELKAHMKQERFVKFLNGVIQKMFRSYTNQTAAMELAKEFGLPLMMQAHSGIDPVNHYLFAVSKDPAKIAENLRKLNVDESKLFIPVKDRFPDGFLYHGTKTEEAFEAILRQGVLPSEYGTAGHGLYGVPKREEQFSIKWGGSKDRLIRFRLDPDTKIIDVTSNPGKKLLASFEGNLDQLAEATGADLIRYEYGSTEAYVTKNGAVLGEAEGVYREVLTLRRAMQLAAEAKDAQKIEALKNSLEVSHFNEAEYDAVLGELTRSNPDYLPNNLIGFGNDLGKLLSYPDYTAFDRAYMRALMEATQKKIIPQVQTPVEALKYINLVAYLNRSQDIKGEFRRTLDEAQADWMKRGFFQDLEKEIAATPTEDYRNSKFYFSHTSPAARALYDDIQSRALMVKGKSKSSWTSVENLESAITGNLFSTPNSLGNLESRPLSDAQMEDLMEYWESKGIFKQSDLNFHWIRSSYTRSRLFQKLVDRTVKSRLKYIRHAADLESFAGSIGAPVNDSGFPFMREVIEDWKARGLYSQLLEFKTPAQMVKTAKAFLELNQKGIPFERVPNFPADLNQAIAEALDKKHSFSLERAAELLRHKNSVPVEIAELFMADHFRNRPSGFSELPDIMETFGIMRAGEGSDPTMAKKLFSLWFDGVAKLPGDHAEEFFQLVEACSRGENPICPGLYANYGVWKAILESPATRDKAWEVAFNLLEDGQHLAVQFKDFPLPETRLRSFLTSPEEKWAKILHESPSFFEWQIMTTDAFLDAPNIDHLVASAARVLSKNYHSLISDRGMLDMLAKKAQRDPLKATELMEIFLLANRNHNDIGPLLRNEDPWAKHPLIKTWLKLAKPISWDKSTEVALATKKSILAKGRYKQLDIDLKRWGDAVVSGTNIPNRPGCWTWFKRFVGGKE